MSEQITIDVSLRVDVETLSAFLPDQIEAVMAGIGEVIAATRDRQDKIAEED